MNIKPYIPALTDLADRYPLIRQNLDVAAATLLAPEDPSALALLNAACDLARAVERRRKHRGSHR